MPIYGTELIAIYDDPKRRRAFEKMFDAECPVCHIIYDNLDGLPRIIVRSASVQQEVCEDCYWVWVSEDITRYFSQLEETSIGFCYVKEIR